MPHKINIWFNGKVVATVINEYSHGFYNNRMICYEGFSEYCKKKRKK